MAHNNELMHGDQTMTPGNFSQVRSRPQPWPNVFVTPMLMRDLFAVDNLLVLDGSTENQHRSGENKQQGFTVGHAPATSCVFSSTSTRQKVISHGNFVAG